ncbi:7490_t:CDS:2 [Rhizophagus irregularis]|nr:7490_t:CDS:2 [Rhizophagus irregularis]
MHIIIFLISLLILCSINLTNCQYPGFPTSPPFLTSTTGFPEPSLTPLPSPTSLLQPTFSNNPFLTPEEPTFGSSDSPIQPSIVTVLSTTTTDKTVFVAVPKPGMEFTVKLWADSAKWKTYRAHVYIDGTWDHVSYTLTDTHSTIIDYFINESDKNKYNFLFAPSLWADDDSNVNLKENKSHGFGSISVEFFEAEWTLKENEKPSINDFNDSSSLLYDTQFEESPLSEEGKLAIKRADHNSIVGIGAYYGWKSADKPSAVLTVHYRPKEWKRDKRITKNNHRNINKSIEKCNGKRVDNSRKDNSRKDRKVSNTPNVKFARYFEEIIEETKFIDIEAGLNNPTEEIRQNKKLREIIEILDSDDDD